MESNLPNSNKKARYIPRNLALDLVVFVVALVQRGQINYHYLRLDVNHMIVMVQKDVPEIKDIPLKDLYDDVTMVIHFAMKENMRN